MRTFCILLVGMSALLGVLLFYAPGDEAQSFQPRLRLPPGTQRDRDIDGLLDQTPAQIRAEKRNDPLSQYQRKLRVLEDSCKMANGSSCGWNVFLHPLPNSEAALRQLLQHSDHPLPDRR